MNGSSDSKAKAAINKAKAVASNVTSSNGSNNGKRRKKDALKPIITTEGPATIKPAVEPIGESATRLSRETITFCFSLGRNNTIFIRTPFAAVGATC